MIILISIVMIMIVIMMIIVVIMVIVIMAIIVVIMVIVIRMIIFVIMMIIKTDRPQSLNSRRSIVAEEEEGNEDEAAESRDKQLPR